MTRGGIREYTKAVRDRYLRAGMKEKGQILDEFTQVTGYNRKAAIRLLYRSKPPQGVNHRGRPKLYGPEVAEALKVAWEATDRLCSKRLQPFLLELVNILKRQGEGNMTAKVEAQLCRMSPVTIYRLGSRRRTLPSPFALPPAGRSGQRRSLTWPWPRRQAPDVPLRRQRPQRIQGCEGLYLEVQLPPRDEW